MFKVGDRVWDKTLKRYLTITEIDDDLFTCGDTYVLEKNAHKTAQTMFEELGYKLILEDSRYIILNYFNYYNLIKTELRINKEDKEYKLSNFTRNNEVFSAHISLQLHQAIHQKLIELGWVE